jgi:GNAT superfamily N-acetyltransferase
LALLLGYTDGQLVGYMGVFTDKIILDGKPNKIGWLSTWWVHPKTKGSGIGREILNTMYESLNGQIGISQFTPSAKRVYDKSGYFYTLKESKGIKAVLRSNFGFCGPGGLRKIEGFVATLEVRRFNPQHFHQCQTGAAAKQRTQPTQSGNGGLPQYY